MNYLNLLDATSAAIVLGGTLFATVIRCGLRASIVTLQVLATAARPRFDASSARAKLALQIQQIQRDGLLRAEPRHFGDREFDDVTDALIEQRSVNVLMTRHRMHKALRLERSHLAVGTLNQAVEMGPVFGLAGTLIALSQLPASGEAGMLLSTSIPGAIITTFYGLMVANLLFAPLARFIQRRADIEESERQDLLDWLTAELAREGLRPQTPQGQIAA